MFFTEVVLCRIVLRIKSAKIYQWCLCLCSYGKVNVLIHYSTLTILQNIYSLWHTTDEHHLDSLGSIQHFAAFHFGHLYHIHDLVQEQVCRL